MATISRRSALCVIFLCSFLLVQQIVDAKISFPEEFLNLYQTLDEKAIKQLTQPTDRSHIQKICMKHFVKDVNGNCVPEETVGDRTVIEIIDVVKLDCKKGYKKVRGKCRKDYEDFKSKLYNVNK